MGQGSFEKNDYGIENEIRKKELHMAQERGQKVVEFRA
jgi:hypothetical protein